MKGTYLHSFYTPLYYLDSLYRLLEARALAVGYCTSFQRESPWKLGFETLGLRIELQIRRLRMWYNPFSTLVGWYLSSAGFESDVDLLKLVDNAITGFRSHLSPESF